VCGGGTSPVGKEEGAMRKTLFCLALTKVCSTPPDDDQLSSFWFGPVSSPYFDHMHTIPDRFPV